MQQRDKIVVDSTVISVLTRNMLGERPKKILLFLQALQGLENDTSY